MVRCKFIKRTDEQQCTRPADPKTGYCKQHYEIVQREKANQTLTTLPPDVLRMITKGLPVREILQKCTIDKQFNQTVCQSLAFWKMLAQDRNLPASLYEDKSIDRLKDLIDKYDRTRSKSYNISAMAFRSEGAARIAEYDPARNYEPYVGQPVRDVLNTIVKWQEKLYTRRLRELLRSNISGNELYALGAEKYPDIITPAEYKQKLDNLLSKLQEYDFIEMDLVVNPYRYLILRNPSGELVVAHTWPDPTSNDYRTIIAPNKIYPLIKIIYDLNDHQPLTRDSFNHWYHPGDINISGFVTDPGRGQASWFGTEADPVITYQGFQFHAIPHPRQEEGQ